MRVLFAPVRHPSRSPQLFPHPEALPALAELATKHRSGS